MMLFRQVPQLQRNHLARQQYPDGVENLLPKKPDIPHMFHLEGKGLHEVFSLILQARLRVPRQRGVARRSNGRKASVKRDTVEQEILCCLAVSHVYYVIFPRLSYRLTYT